MPRAGKWKEEIGWEEITRWIDEAGGFAHEGGDISYNQVRERCMSLSSDESAPSKGSISPHYKEEVRKKMQGRHEVYRAGWRGKWARNLDRFRNAEVYIRKEHKPSLNGWYYTWDRFTIYDFNQREKGNKIMTFKETLLYLEKTQNLDVEADTIDDYWTGETINLNKDAHAFDHLLPKSRGGKGELDNLVVTIRQNNLMHSNMTKEEFLERCKAVLRIHDPAILKEEI